MNVTVRIPDDLAARLSAEGADLERRALEGLVLEEFRAGRLTKAELREALGFAVLNELDGFLKAHGVYEDYTLEEIDREVAAMKRLGFRGRVPLVVADTGPLHYLVLIDATTMLPALYGTVLVPEVVCEELRHPRTPAPVRTWLATNPPWLEPRPTPPLATLPFPKLGDGERAAIALAQAVHAALVLMDDREGIAAARAQGLDATGTLGVLELAAMSGLIDLPSALVRLRRTRHMPRLTARPPRRMSASPARTPPKSSRAAPAG